MQISRTPTLCCVSSTKDGTLRLCCNEVQKSWKGWFKGARCLVVEVAVDNEDDGLYILLERRGSCWGTVSWHNASNLCIYEVSSLRIWLVTRHCKESWRLGVAGVVKLSICRPQLKRALGDTRPWRQQPQLSFIYGTAMKKYSDESPVGLGDPSYYLYYFCSILATNITKMHPCNNYCLTSYT